MSDPAVLVERPADAVGLIRINRPQARNALSREVRERIALEVERMAEAADTRCLVITGTAGQFASGGDIREMAPLGVIEKMSLDRTKRRFSRALSQCPKPIIAAVTGHALGGGCELAMMCDIIVAGESAKFGQPEARVGIMPGSGGTQRFSRALGKHKAMRYLLTGDAFGARQACDMGLVSEVVPDADVERHAVELAARIARLAPLAIEQIKETVLRGLDAALDVGLALETRSNQLLFASSDQKEGMAAFLEKRKPDFKGS